MAMPDGADGPTRRGKNLTPDQVRAIAESIIAGERHARIAERFGVSAQTVRAIKSGKRGASAIDDDLREKMMKAPVVAALDAAGARQIMRALESGRSGRSIAEEYGISPSMVSAIRHGRAWSALDPGLPARLARTPRHGKTLSIPQVAEIKRRLLDGESSRAIAAASGVSASTVLAIARGRTWADVAPRATDSE